MRTRRRFAVNVESLEGKALLSTLPVLTQHTFTQVLHQIDQAAGTYAKNHSPNAFDATLAKISYEIPYGHAQLYPTWQADESIYSPTVPGSGVQMVQQLKTDLKDYVQSSVANGTFGVNGNWISISTVTPTSTTVVPVLSNQTYNSVLKQIDQAAGTYAKNHSASAFDATLSRISSEIPYGHSQLYPTWQADETIYNPTVPGSGVQMVQQLKVDLKDYVATAVADGTIRFS